MLVPALAVAAREHRDRSGGIVVERAGWQNLHAPRSPIKILARVGERDAGVFEENAVGGDAGARGARGHRLLHRRLHVLPWRAISFEARSRSSVQIDQVFADELLDAEVHGGGCANENARAAAPGGRISSV